MRNCCWKRSSGTGSPAQTGGLPHKSWVPWSVAGVLFLAALGLGVVVWRYNTAEPQLMRMSLQTPAGAQLDSVRAPSP